MREADSAQLASALVELAGSPLLRERLAERGLAAVRERTWERALERLADGYRRALAGDAGEAQHRQEVDRLRVPQAPPSPENPLSHKHPLYQTTPDRMSTSLTRYPKALP